MVYLVAIFEKLSPSKNSDLWLRWIFENKHGLTLYTAQRAIYGTFSRKIIFIYEGIAKKKNSTKRAYLTLFGYVPKNDERIRTVKG